MADNIPSFERAEYALSRQRSTDDCTRCAQPIARSYYRVGGALTCEGCALQALGNVPSESHAAFTRALLYGIGAAIVGMLVYAAFEAATGIVIGYLALGVGWGIAKAMKIGSKGRGGRKYQIAAALLTYAAVSMAAIPVAIHASNTHPSTQTTSTNAADAAGDSGGSASAGESGGLGKAIVLLIGVGLASPFLELSDGFGGVIGLIILFVGIRMAWRLMSTDAAGLPDVSGPFSVEPGTA